MYIFHRTSEEKLQIEAPLLVESWNFISTLKRKNKKKKYPTNRETARHYFLLSVSGEPHLLHKCELYELGRAEPKATASRAQHCQHPFSLALPNFLPINPGLHETSMLSVWRKVDGGSLN